MLRDRDKVCLPLVFSLLFWVTASAFAERKNDFSSHSITELKQRLETIESLLDELASISIRGGFGPIGASSRQYDEPEQSIWLEIKLEEETPIEQIALVPAISQNSQGEIQADGFPVEFTILAGTDADRKGREIAHFHESDAHLPRRAPLIIDCSMRASWVRIEISKLSRHALNERYILKLAEVLVFSGLENVALRRPVKKSSGFIVGRSAQHPQFVTDGFFPYIMDAAKGTQSYPLISSGGTEEPHTLSIDLGEVQELSHINLHSLYTNYSVPLYTAPDAGIPHHWILESSLSENFSNPQVLAEVRYSSLLEVGPILQHRVRSLPSRYLRLREITPSFEAHASKKQKKRRSMGFDEIELIANDQNVALGKLFTTNFEASHEQKIKNLTDGNNFYGEVLPIRRWLNELAERRNLEIEREKIQIELDLLYTQQQKRLMWMQRIAIGLAVGILVAILIGRMMGLRKIIQIRERMAANLHDELSADLHAVALLGDLAHKNINQKAKLTDTLAKIQDLSRHSRHSVRHCMNMLQAETACDDLVSEMKRANQRLLSEIDHQFHIDGLEWIQNLPSRKRLDLSLYYKECLINILRHSNASSCQTYLSGTPDHIRLDFFDNGNLINEVPPSLQRRAALLGAEICYQVSQGGENKILLNLKTRPFLLRCFRSRKQQTKDQLPSN